MIDPPCTKDKVMDYNDYSAADQQQQEEACFFQTLADVNEMTKMFGAKNFFFHLLQEYPDLKQHILLK